MKKHIYLLLVLCFYFGLTGQSTLTIPQIMQGQDFVGHWPSNVFWSLDSKTIYFTWNPEQEIISSLYKTSTEGETPIKVSNEERKALPGRFGQYSQDRLEYTYSKNGDLFFYDVANQTTKRLTQTIQTERSPTFNQREDAIIYQQGDNLFQWSLPFGPITQLTHFVDKPDKKDPKLSDQDEWLQRDQLEYFDILRVRDDRSEARKELNESLEERQPMKIAKQGKLLSDLQLSPDERFVTYRLTKRPKTKSTKVPDYVTNEGYLDILNARVKVGSALPVEEAWIFDRQLDTTYRVQTDSIVGILDKPEFLKEYHIGNGAYQDKYEKPRSVVMHGPYYSPGGNANFVVIRSVDNKDRWIMSLNLEQGSLALIDRQRDEAWIGGPGIAGWNNSAGNVGWVDDETLYFQSEETGYSHLYTYHLGHQKKTALTEGKFEIINAQLSQDRKTFFITSNKPGPEQQQFYHLPVEGGELRAITNTLGGHRVTISPDEKHLAILFSYSNKPWEVYLMENAPNAEMKQVTKSTTTAFEAYAWRDPEIVTFSADDGAQVKARLYRPERRKRNGAGVIFVHGAGYLQNVHKWWSNYYREFMFHNFLTDLGYTVLDIDYRASNGYGRDWRTGIYRWMGGKDLSDQVDGAQYMVEELGVDANRIGIYGGSYGGFITLMGLFTSPKTFKCGAALRSVTDWAHYNHGYTSNILNTPVEDSIAFYQSSPIYHAENLEGHLLMLHGMIDRNVQFQDVVRLSQRLIELGKDNWELAVFPKEGHGFIEATSWTDEYKRIYNLFEEHLRK